MFKPVLILLSLTLTVLQTQSCSKQEEVQEIFSLNSKVELLFFYKKESSKEAQNSFYEKVLNKPVAGGYWPRDGVRATFGVDVNGYEGFGISFSKDATDEQKSGIKRLIKESPIVYKVYENVEPNEIKVL